MNKGFYRGNELGQFVPASISGTFTASVSITSMFSGTLLLSGGNGVWSNPRVISGSAPAGLQLTVVKLSPTQWALIAGGWSTSSAGTSNFTIAINTGDGQLVTSAQTITVVSPYAGFDTAFNTFFTYSTTNVTNDNASNAFAAWYTGRSSTSHADNTGKWWGEFVVSVAGGGTVYRMFGLASSACTNNTYMGGGIGDSGGQQTNGTMRFEGIFANPGTTNSGDTTGTSQAVAVYCDTGARKGWLQISSTGNFIGGGNPTTGTNPTFTWPSALTLHLATSLDGAAGTLACILNTGGVAPVNTISSGYSPWG